MIAASGFVAVYVTWTLLLSTPAELEAVAIETVEPIPPAPSSAAGLVQRSSQIRTVVRDVFKNFETPGPSEPRRR